LKRKFNIACRSPAGEVQRLEPIVAAALLEAARLSAGARPGTLDHVVNVAATRSLLRSDQTYGMTGLYQFSRFDPEKIPVVFVHGPKRLSCQVTVRTRIRKGLRSWDASCGCIFNAG
jgi:hypothetical protein